MTGRADILMVNTLGELLGAKQLHGLVSLLVSRCQVVTTSLSCYTT